jgi:hypothetical protein
MRTSTPTLLRAYSDNWFCFGLTRQTTPSIRIIMIGNDSTNKHVNRICLSLSLSAHGEKDMVVEFTFSNAIVYEEISLKDLTSKGISSIM